MSKYNGHAVAMFGTNGTGKSTWMKQVFNRYPAGRNCLMIMDDDSEDMWDYLTEITPDQIPLFKGKAVCYVGDTSKENVRTHDIIYNQFGVNPETGEKEGGLVCWDDAMTVFTMRDEHVKRLFKKRRQRKFDYILNCHGFSEFPISLVKNMTHFIICRSLDSYAHIKSRLNGELAEQLVKIINHVNKESESNPFYHFVFDVREPKNNNLNF
jgi:hypothetical protein